MEIPKMQTGKDLPLGNKHVFLQYVTKPPFGEILQYMLLLQLPKANQGPKVRQSIFLNS
jgi:hypothetical protein